MAGPDVVEERYFNAALPLDISTRHMDRKEYMAPEYLMNVFLNNY